jgi:hypothetical protein
MYEDVNASLLFCLSELRAHSASSVILHVLFGMPCLSALKEIDGHLRRRQVFKHSIGPPTTRMMRVAIPSAVLRESCRQSGGHARVAPHLLALLVALLQAAPFSHTVKSSQVMQFADSAMRAFPLSPATMAPHMMCSGNLGRTAKQVTHNGHDHADPANSGTAAPHTRLF